MSYRTARDNSYKGLCSKHLRARTSVAFTLIMSYIAFFILIMRVFFGDLLTRNVPLSPCTFVQGEGRGQKRGLPAFAA